MGKAKAKRRRRVTRLQLRRLQRRRVWSPAPSRAARLRAVAAQMLLLPPQARQRQLSLPLVRQRPALFLQSVCLSLCVKNDQLPRWTRDEYKAHSTKERALSVGILRKPTTNTAASSSASSPARAGSSSSSRKKDLPPSAPEQSPQRAAAAGAAGAALHHPVWERERAALRAEKAELEESLRKVTLPYLTLRYLTAFSIDTLCNAPRTYRTIAAQHTRSTRAAHAQRAGVARFFS
jgi:cobalamin biosynthesis Mg chelatase CobN